MTLTSLLPPIAAATVLNVFLFALAWHGHQAERQKGTYPWPVLSLLMAYSLAVGGVLWSLARSPSLTTYPEIFVAAAGAEIGAAVVVFAILNALYFTRGQGAENRIGPIVVAIMLTGGLIGAAFY